jgi:hypothetical protein
MAGMIPLGRVADWQLPTPFLPFGGPARAPNSGRSVRDLPSAHGEADAASRLANHAGDRGTSNQANGL